MGKLSLMEVKALRRLKVTQKVVGPEFRVRKPDSRA